MSRIQKVSGRFRLFFFWLMFIVPLVEALFWLFFNQLPTGNHFVLTNMITQDLSAMIRLQLFAVSLIPMGVIVFGFFTLVKLFDLYEKKVVFSPKNVKYYRTLGYTAIIWVIAKFIYVPVCSVIISLNLASGGFAISLGMESVDLMMLVVGGVTVLISWVMDEGRQLEDDQVYTI